MIKIDVAEPDISIFFIPGIFLVKSWSLHYPQSNSPTDGSVWRFGCVMLVAANVAWSRGEEAAEVW